MRALDPKVVDAIWTAVSAYLPTPPADLHPLGCHRRRVPDRAVFDVILIRLVTGCSWVDAERLAGGKVSDTTARARRDEWIAAGVFDALVREAIAGYDRIINLDMSECAIDGSAQKAPCGGEGTGPSSTDRGKLGWKWSMFTDRNGIPLGWATAGGNHHDMFLLAPTLAATHDLGVLAECESLHLDRGYDNRPARDLALSYGVGEVMAAKRRPRGTAVGRTKVPLGQRWPIERTNSWLCNFGQLRRNTDRRTHHRLAQFALAVAFIIAAKLIDWRDRWSPALA